MCNEAKRGLMLPLMLIFMVLVAGCTAVMPIDTASPAGEPAADATKPANAAVAAPAAASAEGETSARNLATQLARQLQIDPSVVEIVSVEPVEWPDACLGAAAPGEMCAQVVTPGYRITLEVEGKTYLYHTDTGPYWMRLVEGPEPAIGDTVMTWTGTVDNGSCQEAEIGMDGVAFGYCGGIKVGGKFATPARADALADFAARYASFAADTEAGEVVLAGAGDQIATAEEQARLARWAQFAVMEAAAGIPTGSLAYYGPEEPGSLDTAKCAFLMAGGGPDATLGACDGTAKSVPLGERSLAELQELADRFAPFVYETATESLRFDGMGAVDAAAWRPAILAWARTRYAELASGKVSAAGSTALSWDLGQAAPGEAVDCKHLTVLAWGYAYAEVRPCAGGDVKDLKMGWLSTPELESLNVWLNDRAPWSDANAYVTGTGVEAMTDDDVAAAQAWSEQVWQRIWSDYR